MSDAVSTDVSESLPTARSSELVSNTSEWLD